MRIFITGCARSGTTLLARMFNAFEGVNVISEEISLENFIEKCSNETDKNKIIVGKRTEYSIFSNILSDNTINDHLKLIEDNDIIVINCVRDGRFVVDSWLNAWGMYNPFAWMCSIIQSKEHKNIIKATIYYEHLIKEPNFVQSVIEVLLNRKANKNFSDYPSFVPKSCFSTDNDKYSLRKLDLKVKEVPNTYKRKPNDIKTFNELIKNLGYE